MEDFRRVVVKDSTECLKSELKRARPSMEQTEIEEMSREELVDIITQMKVAQ